MFWKLREWAEGQGRAWQRAAPRADVRWGLRLAHAALKSLR